MTANYYNPVHSVYGAGAVSRLKELLAGRKAVLVTFPEARGLGLTARIEEVLQESLSGIIDNVQPNPDVAELRPVYERFWREHADTEVIVAVGGGSTIDTAKALMVDSRSGKFDELVELLANGTPFVPARHKMLVAVPTTAGTGSEVTPWATIWDREKGKKYSLHLPQTWPAYAVIDPQLMLSLPPSVTLQSGLDALSHALEAIWNVNANPVSDTFAVAAATDILDVLPRLMRDLGDSRLRGRMALAALKAGMAFSNTKTALAHSISYEMTLRHGLPHGIACSFPLPMVCERAIGKDTGRDAVLMRIFGADLSRAPQKIAAFIEGLGVKTRFIDYGVDDDEAARMVTHALSGVRGKNFIGAASA
jgi:phosphonate metabolism-associated iron-containing alcohol dehydrogenase